MRHQAVSRQQLKCVRPIRFEEVDDARGVAGLRRRGAGHG